MGFFDANATLQRSISRITLVACVAGVVLAGLGLAVVHIAMMHRAQVREKQALAGVIASNATASLAFNDRGAAEEILASLAAQPAIRTARLTRTEGTAPFATYFASKDTVPGAANGILGWRPPRARFSVEQPVQIGTQVLGRLEIDVDLTPALLDVLWSYVALLPLVLGISGGVAWWAGRRLQRRFVGPLFTLLDTANDVSATGDYALRAPAGREDEIGRLIETFNVMLGRIQVQQGQLRVSEMELSRKVTDLEAEIMLRHQAEQRRHEADAERLMIERKMQEAQRLEGLGIMAGGIAHDFNNLLTAMLGHSSLARIKAPAGSPLLTHLSAIEVAARRATELCRQMLIYTGRRKPEYTIIDIDALLAEMVSLLEVSVGKNCKLELSTTPGAEAHRVSGDAAQIRQVLLNLVVNAADAIGAAAGAITTAVRKTTLADTALKALRFSAEAVPGDYVEISVRDTGCGMTPEVLGRIFDPFFSTKFTGRGLGLAAVASIMRHHHGALHVASTQGEGTVFYVYLPAAAAVAEAAVTPVLAAPGGALVGEVLVVDDEEAPRTAVTAMLAYAGNEVKSAAGAIEALGIFGPEGEGFGAAVLDFTMPGMNGGMLAEALRMIRPDLPVLIISGHINEAEMNIPPKVHFLRKPFTSEELSAAVNEARRLAAS